MTRLLTLSLVLFAGIGCNDSDNTGNDGDVGTDNPDGTETFDGLAWLSSQLTVNDAPEQCTVTAYGPDGLTVSGSTGDELEIPTSANGETFTVEFGDPGTLGCDGQALHPSGSEFYMALTEDLELADGDTVDIQTNAFRYYEWGGALQCEAWDDWGWHEQYDAEELTDNGKTCVDADGELDLDELNITLDFSSGSVTIDIGTVTEFEISSNGFYANLDNGMTYVNCVVVD